MKLIINNLNILKKSIIDYFNILKLFFRKYLPAAIKECRDEIMYELGSFLLIMAGAMLFFFCLFGLLMTPIAFYVYVAVMAVLAFIGIILKAMFSPGKEEQKDE